MFNYFYPATITDPNLLQVGDYGVWYDQLYLNSFGSVIIVRSKRFIYYDLNNPGLYEVNCGTTTVLCVNKVLFDMKNSNWVLFKTVTTGCGCTKKCSSVIESIVCQCGDDIDIPCYHNVIEGNSNTVTGLANNTEGNNNSITGLFNYSSGTDLLLPASPITIDGILFASTATPGVYTITIPGNYLAQVTGHAFLMILYQDRYYALLIYQPMPFFDGVSTIVNLIPMVNCNEIPPFGLVPSVIPTTNFQNEDHGGSNVDFSNSVRTGVDTFPISYEHGFNVMNGMANVIQGGRGNHIHGQQNGPRDIFTVTSGVTSLPLTYITPLNKPFTIAYFNFNTGKTGTSTLTRVAGLPDTINAPLGNGTYSIIIMDAIRFAAQNVTNVLPEALFPFMVTLAAGQFNLITVLYKLDTDTEDRVGLLYYDLVSGLFTLYPNTVNADFTVGGPVIGPGYMRCLFDRSFIHGNVNKLNGTYNANIGDTNLMCTNNSMIIGDGNRIVGGKRHLMVGRNNTVAADVKGETSIIFGQSNSQTDNTHATHGTPTNPSVRYNMILGNEITYESSYNFTVGEGNHNRIPYSMQISADNYNKTSTIGHIQTASISPFTGFDVAVSYVNGMPVLAGNGNLIANIGSTTVDLTHGFANTTNIQYVQFPVAYSVGGRIDQLPVDALSAYQFVINGDYTYGTVSADANVFNKYFLPTYEIRFQTNGAGVVVADSFHLFNNQVVFNGDAPVNTVLGASAVVQLDPSLWLFVNQTDAYFIRLAFAYLSSGQTAIQVQSSSPINTLNTTMLQLRRCYAYCVVSSPR